jgi:peptidoglycan/LPS O-acetylase OafA/YrhL
MVCGTALQRASSGGGREAAAERTTKFFVDQIGLAVLLYAKSPQLQYFGDRDLHLTLLALGTAALMVAGVRVTVGSTAAALLRPLIACGRRSYEIYLTHGFVVLAAVAWFQARGAPPGAVYPLVGAVLALSWCLGAAVERWLSAPANRWLRGKFDARGALDDACARLPSQTPRPGPPRPETQS